MPLEVWEHVLDCLKDEPRTLRATEVVCKAWRPRSRFHLNSTGINDEGSRYLYGNEDAYPFGMLLQADPRGRRMLAFMYVEGRTAEDGRQGSLAHLGTVAATLARFAPFLENFEIRNGQWMAGTIHQDVFLHLSAFTSVKELWLNGVTFPSITVFGRLVCSLGSLGRLEITGPLTFTDSRLPSSRRRWAFPPVLVKLGVTARVSLDVFRSPVVIKPVNQYKFIDFTSAPLEVFQSLLIRRLLKNNRSSLERFSIDLSSLLSMSGTAVHDLVGRNLDLSRNTVLRALSLYPFLEERHLTTTSTYDVYQQIISTTSPDSLETVDIRCSLRSTQGSTSDVLGFLNRLCREFSPLDRVLSPERYTALRIVGFCVNCDEKFRESLEDHWNTLAAIHFANLHARKLVRLYLSDR
ncbi:hypothetical protein WOLCODRAFT_159159 [Wolfiporia cocos MD-104 SS10]|uniref:F-box domain-containing protein n=1 Tax=Wolfiporia cocos (strain MD-104) TaxID=742152 RepID=A0A2H3JDC3_WOLCO|nr:hypothetical protein WOLCODRAFT_159159 [Wolfiporia cocos MD-104 SS10]